MECLSELSQNIRDGLTLTVSLRRNRTYRRIYAVVPVQLWRWYSLCPSSRCRRRNRRSCRRQWPRRADRAPGWCRPGRDLLDPRTSPGRS